MDKKLFKSKMVLFGDTLVKLSAAIGISRSRLCAKINESNGAEFSQSEITKIKYRYKLTSDEVNAIFFAK